jgi:hypothetical protein
MSWQQPWEAHRDPEPPEVPGYEVGELIGVGASAAVWSAVRRADGVLVALKVVPGGAPADVDAAVRELAVLRRLASQHLLAVHDALAVGSGDLVLVVDHLAGGSLRQVVLARGHLSPEEAVTVLSPVASALGRLHTGGVVHGDVSPGNVLLDRSGRPVLADLGTARVTGLPVDDVHGTDGFVAPEVLAGSDPSPAADVYAVGALGWLCLTGEAPGVAALRGPLAGMVTALRRQGGADEQAPLGPAYESLIGVVERCLATDPALRPEAVDLAHEIFGCAVPQPLLLVRGDDEVSALTHRIRAVASPQTVTGDARSRARHGRPRVRRPRVRRPRVRRPLGGAWTLAGSLALLLAGVLVASVVASRSSRAAAEPGTRAPAVATTGATGSTGPDLLTDRTAAGTDPRGLMSALADRRAVVWMAGVAARLGEVDARGSAAMRRDTSALAQAQREGLHYRGLSFSVGDTVAVTASRAAATVRTRVDTAAYDVVWPNGHRTARPASPGTEVLVDLVWTGQGWRVGDVRSASP